ncbi:MAG: hypothetical protein IAE79_01605 [Anaerolinea sp.]|nr:hypothetical protein [Anaerolinea sp.]
MDENEYLKKLKESEKENQANDVQTYAQLFLVVFWAVMGAVLFLVIAQNQADFWRFASLVIVVGPVWIYLLKE